MLDFSDRSFSDFLASEVKLNIDDPKCVVNGGPKGKRLRHFLQTCDDGTAEAFLKGLFDAFGPTAQEPFRLHGKQIDDSFQLASDIYLLEAKWHGPPIGVAELHTFHGKIEQKAAWTRGLFVSNSDFTEDGLAAFGCGKRVICMDGLDLNKMLNYKIPLTQVLERKVRRAAETGAPFIRVRDLFPY
ncbi:restriction endonuclease [Xanthomonas arboricola]|uniref:restriction endonuclease n=1 Tax=Xanthomonas arboricola TaxID=56448 RepID=UPI001FD64DCB|nr:restriction endonuclease [Xanthomonas arboricola]UOS98731.1 restriction endonuclease [Xanthomonas arboricola]